MVMFGWSLWKSAANFFIVGSEPTHEEKVTVVGVVGSFTGPWPLPALVSGLLPLPQATSALESVKAVTTCAVLEKRFIPKAVAPCSSRDVTDATCKSIGLREASS